MIAGLRVAKIGKKTITTYLYATVENATFECTFFYMGNAQSNYFKLTSLHENADGSETTMETVLNDAEEFDVYPSPVSFETTEWESNEAESNAMYEAMVQLDKFMNDKGVDFWV